VTSDFVKLVAVGDIQANREHPETLFDLVRDHFKWGDVRICQLEAVLSDKGIVRTDIRNPAHRVSPKNVKALTSIDINLVSFAGNNNLDYGLDAFYDTIDLLHKNGIQVVGAGTNLFEARKPVILEINKVKIAFLNFCSLLRDGFAATESRGGISPLKVLTSYQPLENIYEQPGTPAKTITIPDHRDFSAMLDCVKKAKEEADLVVVSFHWGVHFTYDLAIYQPELAYAAIDAGADLILGTHPHCLQAIDVYKGKYIFYSLGNFAFEQEPISHRGVAQYLSFYGLPTDSELPQHPHPKHCRKTMMAKIVIKNKEIISASILPVYFNSNVQPEPLSANSPMHKEIVDQLNKLCSEIGTHLAPDGDELIIQPEKEKPIDTRVWVKDRPISYPWLQRLATENYYK